MKLLLDHNMPKQLRPLLVGHDARTTRQMRWEALTNGVLLREAADAGFGAIITVDKKMRREQNLRSLPLPVVTLDARSNAIDGVRPFVADLLKLLATPLDMAVYWIRADGSVVRFDAGGQTTLPKPP